jgi:hypothetical protein
MRTLTSMINRLMISKITKITKITMKIYSKKRKSMEKRQPPLQLIIERIIIEMMSKIKTLKIYKRIQIIKRKIKRINI